MPNNPYLIAGGLPWGQGGGGMFDYMSASDPEKALASHYQAAYSSALDMNQANYANILQGYRQAALGQMGGQAAIGKGYKQLLSDVMGQLKGQGRSGRQDITDQYAAAQGAAQQQLVGSGLGNSTVTSNVARGLTYDEAKANNQLTEQLANMMAGYQSNLGQARLNFKAKALNDRNSLAQNQLNWMNSIQAQYPDASAYSQLAQGLGAAKSAKEQQQFLRSMLSSAASGYGTNPMGSNNPLQGGNAAGYLAGQLAAGGAFGSLSGGRPGGFSMPGGGGGGYQGIGTYGQGGSSMTGGFGDAYGQQARSQGIMRDFSNPYGMGGSGFGGGFANPGGYQIGSGAGSPYSGLQYISGGSPYGGGSGFGGGFGGTYGGGMGAVDYAQLGMGIMGGLQGMGGTWGGS